MELAANTKAIENAKAGAKAVTYSIKDAPGLQLVVHPGGLREWFARYQIGQGRDGRRLSRIRIGRADDIGWSEAKARCAEYRKNARAGIDPNREQKQKREAPTFAQLAEKWIAFRAKGGGKRKSMGERHRSESARRVKQLPEWFSEKKAHDVKRSDVSELLDEVAERGVTVETNKVLSLVNCTLAWGASEGHIESNPAYGIERRFRDQSRQRCFTADELRKIWDGVGTMNASERTKLAIKVCISTGQRPTDIVQLLRSGVSLGASKAVKFKDTKNGTDHTLPISDLTAELLSEAMKLSPGSEWVFPADLTKRRKKSVESELPAKKASEHLDSHSISRSLHRMRGKGGVLFGVEDAELYDAKKTCATVLGDAGYVNEQIGIYLNHLTATKGSVTGKNYNSSSYLSLKTELMQVWARHLDLVLDRTVADAVLLQFPAKA